MERICEQVRGKKVFEFGTFTGKSTQAFLDAGASLVVSIDAVVKISDCDYGEYVQGEDIRSSPDLYLLLTGDSKIFDLSPYYRQFDIVVIDGGHDYETCLLDSFNALRLVREEGGTIFWDDSGWEDVAKVLKIFNVEYLPGGLAKLDVRS